MRSFYVLIFALLSWTCCAQYLPNNAQVFQFYPVVNPAFSGIENFNDVRFSYRYQWTGFGENAPRFVNLSYNTRFKQPLDLAYNSLRVSNPMKMRSQGLPKGKRMIIGSSFNLFQSSIGAISSIGGGMTVSFNYPLQNSWRVAGGLGAFIENRRLDMSKVSVRDADNDRFYNHLLGSSTAQTDLNLRAGVLLYNNVLYIGASYLPLVYEAIKSTDLAMNVAFYKMTFQTGVALQANDDVVFKPSFIGMVQLDNSLAYDLNVKAYIQDRVWGGLTYRSIEAGVIMAGFNFTERFSLSYAYELSLSRFQQFSDGSHELLLALRLNNFKRQNQYTW